MTLPQRQVVSVRNPNSGEPLDVAMENAATATNQEKMIAQLASLNSLVPSGYDQILFEYSGDDMTKVTFKAKGETVATLEMMYRDHRLVDVSKLSTGQLR